MLVGVGLLGKDRARGSCFGRKDWMGVVEPLLSMVEAAWRSAEREPLAPRRMTRP